MNCLLRCHLLPSPPPVSSVTRRLWDSNECWPAVASGPICPLYSLRALWIICSPHAAVCVTGYANIQKNMLIRVNEYSLTLWNSFGMTVWSWDSMLWREGVAKLCDCSVLASCQDDSPGDLRHKMRLLVWSPGNSSSQEAVVYNFLSCDTFKMTQIQLMTMHIIYFLKQGMIFTIFWLFNGNVFFNPNGAETCWELRSLVD